MGDTTERSEGLKAGTFRFVGKGAEVIDKNFILFLENQEAYDAVE